MSVTHDTFVLERTYPVPPARVFAAWADLDQKRAWFHGPDDWPAGEHTLDFRVGGTETAVNGPADGPKARFSAHYVEIRADARIVTTYTMHQDTRLMSVSVATVELEALEEATRLTYTEQGAYLEVDEDGWDPAGRREGTEGLLDALGGALDSIAV
jgi:uncharacterized protein YndB with AHSA1/START domain